MAPFTMRCDTCGEYVYQRKKFNARKETVRGEDYLGIEIFRFFIKCPRCASEITFKTDPQNTDYVCEHGATRNFEPWRDEKFIEKELNEELARDEEANPMKALESRTMESKREMEILESLDDIRTINARAERVNPDDVLEKIVQERLRKKLLTKTTEEKNDEEFAKSVFVTANGEQVIRALDEEEDVLLLKVANPIIPKFNELLKKPAALSDFAKLKSQIIIAKKRKSQTFSVDVKRVATGLTSLQAYYDSDDE